jgi:pyruvate,water dikinase
VETRKAAEAAAFAVLAGSPRRLRAFRDLLAETQRLVPLREEQTSELTLPWPVMRRAVLRIGEELVRLGAITAADDVFFLTRAEALGALRGSSLPATVDVAQRRATREEQAKLVPPPFVGQVNRAIRAMPGAFTRMVGGFRSELALVTGSPASPGRATGSVRVIRGPNEFDQLQLGEILVAAHGSGWTPLFTCRRGVTDVAAPRRTPDHCPRVRHPGWSEQRRHGPPAHGDVRP